jgi:hypothetical protein
MPKANTASAAVVTRHNNDDKRYKKGQKGKPRHPKKARATQLIPKTMPDNWRSLMEIGNEEERKQQESKENERIEDAKIKRRIKEMYPMPTQEEALQQVMIMNGMAADNIDDVVDHDGDHAESEDETEEPPN